MPTAIGAYATTALVKGRLDSGTSYTAADDTLLGYICDQSNQFIESSTGRILAPIASATYTFDGDGTRMLYVPVTSNGTPIGGIRAATVVEIADYTGGSYTALGASEFLLRGKVGMTGPYAWLVLSDRATTRRWFPVGYDTVRVTATAGWTTIPDDIIEVALYVAIRAWTARMAGQPDVIGVDEYGRPIVSEKVLGRHAQTLASYRLPVVQSSSLTS